MLSTTVPIVESARDLGVILDNRLTLSTHAAALCRAGYYQLRQLRPLVQSMIAETERTVAKGYPVGWTIVIHCSTVCRTLYCASCNLCRTPLHDWSLARDVVMTSRRYYANSIGYPSERRLPGEPDMPLWTWHPLGRWLLTCVIQHSTLSAVSWRSDLHGSANTQQLRRQNFCSRWNSPVELSSGPATQSRHHLRSVSTTAKGTTFSGSMNTALCDLWYATP